MPRAGGAASFRSPLLLVPFVLSVVACTSTVDEAVPTTDPPAATSPGALPERAPTTVRVGLGVDPLSLDPRTVADPEGELVVRALFDGLVDVAPEGSVVPAAATWQVEDDGLTYRFTTRVERFHDGTRVTAQHHADALLAVFDPDRPPFFREDLLADLRGAVPDVVPDDEAAARAGEGPPEEEQPEPSPWGGPDDIVAAGGIEVVGDRELVLRLREPDPLLLYRLADPVLSPIPRAALLDPAGFAREPIGNGPFRMLGPREPGAFVRLTAHPTHPTPPRIDDLVLQVYADDAERTARWQDLLAGRLQIAAIPAAERDAARDRFGAATIPWGGSGLHEQPLAGLYAYGFVLDVAPTDDVDLRRAISASIDRVALAAALTSAGVAPADAILPPGIPGAVPDCAHCRRDVTLARDLIAAWRARLPEDAAEPRISLTYPRGGGHVAVAERVASDIERTLGLDVRLRARDFSVLVREVEAGAAPLFRVGLLASLQGRAAGVSVLDRAFAPGGPENWVRWDDPRTTALLGDWTPGTAPTAVREIEAAILDSGAIVPLLWTRADLVVAPEVLGFRLDPTGRWWPELLRLR